MQEGDLDPLPSKDVPLRGSQPNTFPRLSPQTSLNKLLEALGKAEPFFIRCIRSNAEKVRGSPSSREAKAKPRSGDWQAVLLCV